MTDYTHPPFDEGKERPIDTINCRCETIVGLTDDRPYRPTEFEKVLHYMQTSLIMTDDQLKEWITSLNADPPHRLCICGNRDPILCICGF